MKRLCPMLAFWGLCSLLFACPPELNNKITLIENEVGLATHHGFLSVEEKALILNSVQSANCDSKKIETLLSLTYKAITAKVFLGLKEGLLNLGVNEEAGISPYKKYVIAQFESCQQTRIIYLVDGSYSHDWNHPFGQDKIEFNLKDIKTVTRKAPGSPNKVYLYKVTLITKTGTYMTFQREKFTEDLGFISKFFWDQFSQKLLGPFAFDPFLGEILETKNINVVTLDFPSNDKGQRAEMFETNLNLAIRACMAIK